MNFELCKQKHRRLCLRHVGAALVAEPAVAAHLDEGHQRGTAFMAEEPWLLHGSHGPLESAGADQDAGRQQPKYPLVRLEP